MDKYQTLVRFGVNKVLLAFNRVARVFCFHGIDFLTNSDVEGESLPVKLFCEEIDYINKNFEIICIEEFDHRLKGLCLSGKEAVLTFDDGYESMIRVVDPILRAKGLPYTIFVSTNYITSGELYPTTYNRLLTRTGVVNNIQLPSIGFEHSLEGRKNQIESADLISHELKNSHVHQVERILDELKSFIRESEWETLIKRYPSVKPMNWDMVKELSRRGGVTIGSHCCQHICCHGKQDIEDLRSEIVGSKDVIEKQLGKPCDYFAYPNGMYTNESNNIVRENYSLGFSTSRNERISYSSDYAVVPRISATYNIDYFKMISAINPR